MLIIGICIIPAKDYPNTVAELFSDQDKTKMARQEACRDTVKGF